MHAAIHSLYIHILFIYHVGRQNKKNSGAALNSVVDPNLHIYIFNRSSEKATSINANPNRKNYPNEKLIESNRPFLFQ